MKIGIVGGGILGLSLGYYLRKRGHIIHIYERNPFLGGLACSHDYGHFIWDKFYHVILPQDTHLLELLKEIGLESEFRWRHTGTGYWAGGKFHSLSNTRQMLQFPLLTWSDKVRMGLATMYTLRFARPGRLYRITAKQWLIKTFGQSNYKIFWKPLLRAKFGEYADQVAAVFIWAAMKRLFGARTTVTNMLIAAAHFFARKMTSSMKSYSRKA
jgi:protoporphyrinogen oxidase